MFALIGNRINYTLSNKIHNLIWKINDINNNYIIKDFDKEKFEEFFIKGEVLDYEGFNITIPYKEDVIKYLDFLVDEALELKVVNTVKVSGYKLTGYNTDYLAFKEIVDRSVFSNKEVYILGTGGAAKICYKVFSELGFGIIVVSRDPKRELNFKKVISYETFRKVKKVSTLVNATPIGNINNPDVSLINANQEIDFVIDLNYSPLNTKVMKMGKRSINGLEMLILQAIFANEIWFDLKLKKDEKTIKLIKEEIKI